MGSSLQAVTIKGVTTFVNTTFDGLANNATSFPDAAGTLNGCSWSAVGAAKATTTSPLVGSSSLLIPNCTADAIECAYNAANGIPRSGSWKLYITAQSAGSWNTGGVGKTFLSCQDAGATGAGTVFGLATNASSGLVILYSDGVSRNVTSPFVTLTSATAAIVVYYKAGNTGTFGISVNGGAFTTVSLPSFTFNGVPAGSPKWRLGNSLSGNAGAEQWKFNNFRIERNW